MTEVTLEAVRARQSELAAMIEQLASKTAPQPSFVSVEEIDIALEAGEHYAGVVLGQDGQVGHHLVLMAPRPGTDLDWKAAKAWAESVGGELPTRQEAALLYANCKEHVDARWHWTSEVHEDNSSCAWFCDFISGYQDWLVQLNEGCARAVRRVNP